MNACRHHWVGQGDTTGPEALFKCKLCGAERVFSVTWHWPDTWGEEGDTIGNAVNRREVAYYRDLERRAKPNG